MLVGVVDDVGAEHSKASKQLHSSDPEVSIQLEDNENNGVEKLRCCKLQAVNDTFQRNSNTWKSLMEVPRMSHLPFSLNFPLHSIFN